MLAEARQVVPEQGPAEVKRRLDAGEPVVVVDVRDPDEYRDGHIEDAANISRGFLEFRIGTVAPEPTTPIVLYCQTGLRSMLAAQGAQGPRLRERDQPAGRLPEVGAVRPARGQGQAAHHGADPALQPPLPPAAGGREGPAQAAPLQGPADRRGRARLADRALPGRGRRRHHRAHGRRRGGRVESPAPDPPHHRQRRAPQGRVGHGDASAR